MYWFEIRAVAGIKEPFEPEFLQIILLNHFQKAMTELLVNCFLPRNNVGFREKTPEQNVG